MKTTRFDEDQAATKPTTEIEWLMMRDGEPAPSSDVHNLIVEEALTALPDESQWILQAIFYERITYEELGQRLGVSKPHAWRLTQRAVNQLKQLLINNPTLKDRYS
jgi:RNA polymerase sigma factor (sigma-70 family)